MTSSSSEFFQFAALPDQVTTTPVFLDEAILRTVQKDGPLHLHWPTPDNPGGVLSISSVSEWRAFVLGCSLRPGIPEIVAAKFRRAQMLYFLAWLYFDLIKAGELVALTTLELALKDRYGHYVKDRKGNIHFSRLLKYMLNDGLTDQKIPMIRRCGGSAIGFVNGDSKPDLAELRNRQAHGDPFDALPVAGLLELVRDLIEYAYRDLDGREADMVAFGDSKR
jgi:hypothetical protein